MERYDQMTRERVVETIERTKSRSGWAVERILRALGIAASSYYAWCVRPGGPDWHRAFARCKPLIEEIAAVRAYALTHPTDGYRRLAWMMLDEDVAAFSESSVYRILRDAGLTQRWNSCSSVAGTVPAKPRSPDEQWHTDLMYLWVNGRWYFFIAVLDAYSRYIVHWELLLSMTGGDVTAVMHRAIELTPEAKPRIIHDRGVQFTGREFRSLVKHFGLEDIKIRVNHPQSNGVYERFNGSTRQEGLRDIQLRDVHHAREVLSRWVDEYNHRRLHSALGYLPPIEYYRGNPEGRQRIRKAKLEAARNHRMTINLQESNQAA